MSQKVTPRRAPFLTYFAIGFCFDNPILDPLAVRFMYSQILTGLDWLSTTTARSPPGWILRHILVEFGGCNPAYIVV